MKDAFENIEVGQAIEGPRFAVTRETIRAFCDASLDYNPLHLDDEYMKGNFGRTTFGGIIMHGMTNFGLMTRMLTDWLYERGGLHRRLETRWRSPVRPGDTIQPHARVTQKKVTHRSRWVLFDVEVRNQAQAVVATGEAMAEFPYDLTAAIRA
jgi:acyl dehydratase